MQNSKNNVAPVRDRLIEICDRVERGEETTNEERYFYNSLAYFYDRHGNVGAIDEFLHVAAAVGLC